MSVGLVIVSHSEKIAEGVVELAAQMAPDVVIVAAGGVAGGDGDAAGRIGTSFERVQSGIGRAMGGDGVVVLTDLGSAVMTAEMALEFLDAEARGSVRLAEAALVEGAVAAAVQSQSGASLEDVLRAAEAAVVSIRPDELEPFVSQGATGRGKPDSPGAASSGSHVSGVFTLPNRMGLHARPAALLASGLLELDADVTVNGVDATSVMLLMSLGLGQGRTVSVEASGPDAQAALEFIGDAVESGFGEPS
ncbi:HPr family phosphocarrier protein [Arthrobacter echini]|uniref:Phosphocarrier protein HPr n=1 Tax=Arthrobacter echini TaxID=1529066 RepID=A0A4S5E1J0_9MICC|nr:dihydroxyacetone kinase phosphoryl donor subunit DhaM [Arthrobacter echini]THJ65152.1 HPr family phosphocarrier protein [Arthrobacter echini]